MYIDGKSYCWLAKRMLFSFSCRYNKYECHESKVKFLGGIIGNWCIVISNPQKSNKAINLGYNSCHESVEGGGSMPHNFPRLHPVVHLAERCYGCIFDFIQFLLLKWEYLGSIHLILSAYFSECIACTPSLGMFPLSSHFC